ncbi:hypothetical protein A3712_22105 [Vibrio sp. HI00D65]|uniref:hypothetical protein n=1 Tax=Vibrio sp. HI00D65 TaxID=1822216 RepID=UPI0007B94ED3|nr:hypothetical protein [Vibrio sp. HI00D65]KZX62443.1 hypothetical protein A3712_22105 [Vibrio sp. HI00D65]
MLSNKIKSSFLPLVIFSSCVAAESEFVIEDILDGQQVSHFALGDTDGDGSDEIIFMDQYGNVKIAKNLTNPNTLNMLVNTRWSLSENWKLQFLDQAYPSTDIRVAMTYEHNGNVFKSGTGIASKKDGKIEVNINGFSGNPAVTINYVSVAKGTMKGSYKDIQYSGSRSYPMNARKE